MIFPRDVALVAALIGCASTGHHRQPIPAAPTPARTGHIESVREVGASDDDRTSYGAIDGVVVGLLLIDLLFPHTSVFPGPGVPPYGAAAGAEYAGKGGNAKPPHTEVTIRFDDGGTFTLDYPGGTQLRPGDRVALTPHGLDRSPVRVAR